MPHRSFRALIALALLVPEMALAAPAALPEPRVPVANPFANVRDLLACTQGKGTLVSAHRGGAAPGYPENALESAAHTLSAFPALLELDVRRSSDGVLVLMHDDTLDRTTTGTGPVAQQDWASLSQLYLEDNDGGRTSFRIPRFADALKWARGRALVLAEVKISDTLSQIVEEIHASDAKANVMLLINSLDDAKRLQALDPEITMTLEIADAAALDRVKAAGINMRRVVPWTGIGKRDRAFWQALHGEGLAVSYGTLWYVDGAIENLDLRGIYAELARDGVDLLATDRAPAAYAEIASARPIDQALHQCKAVPAPAR